MTGLVFNWKFGGITGVVSGSATANLASTIDTGVSFGTFSVVYGVYANSDNVVNTLVTQNTMPYNSPYFDGSLEVSSGSVSIALDYDARINFEISFLGNLL